MVKDRLDDKGIIDGNYQYLGDAFLLEFVIFCDVLWYMGTARRGESARYTDLYYVIECM